MKGGYVWRGQLRVSVIMDECFLSKMAALFSVVVLAFGFMLYSCENPTNENKSSTVSYTVDANGIAGMNDTTVLTFSLSAAVNNLNANDITITSISGDVIKGELLGNSTVWELGITVVEAGDIKIRINKSEIENNEKQVTVHKNTLITYTVSADGTAWSSNTASLTLAFNTNIDDLNISIDDITVSGAASRENAVLSGAGDIRVLSQITVNSAGTASVQLNKEGIEGSVKSVAVHKKQAGLFMVDTENSMTPVNISDASGDSILEKAWFWIVSNAEPNNSYTIMLDMDEPQISGDYWVYGGITITLKGIDAQQPVLLTGNIRLSGLSGSGITFVLDTGITLQGSMYVSKDNVLLMKDGSKITGTGNGIELSGNGRCIMEGGEITENGGDGVYISTNGAFTMNSGGIFGNNGRGVNAANGRFTMNGGKISENNGEIPAGSTGYGEGGGVYLSRGRFDMNNGEISGNTVKGNGGGVYISAEGMFTMRGGEISGNTAANYSSSNPNFTAYGGGVYVKGDFRVYGGKITSNTAEQYGGGIFITSSRSVVNNQFTSGQFYLSGGDITDNIARKGGGVYIDTWGTFTMYGGNISRNTANNGWGGGVYVYQNGSFKKQHFLGGNTSGIIYGFSHEEPNSNAANNAYAQTDLGHAVYAVNNGLWDTTVDEDHYLDTDKDGVAGGW